MIEFLRHALSHGRRWGYLPWSTILDTDCDRCMKPIWEQWS